MMNITSPIFTNLAVRVLCNPTFYTFLKRAEGGFASNDIRKVVPQNATSKHYTIISISNSASFRQHQQIL